MSSRRLALGRTTVSDAAARPGRLRPDPFGIFLRRSVALQCPETPTPPVSASARQGIAEGSAGAVKAVRLMPGPSDPEKDWISRIGSGDRDAFSRLFHTYYARLCAFAVTSVGSLDLAEELVSDVFLSIWERREAIEVRASVRSYLFTAVRYRVQKHLDHRRVVERTEEWLLGEGRIPAMGESTPLPDEWASVEELASAARRAIDSLPDRAREVYLLYRQQGLSYAEIAEVTGVARKTVENQLARAVKLLHQRLQPWLG